jgi:hypothetical protein
MINIWPTSAGLSVTVSLQKCKLRAEINTDHPFLVHNVRFFFCKLKLYSNNSGMSKRTKTLAWDSAIWKTLWKNIKACQPGLRLGDPGWLMRGKLEVVNLAISWQCSFNVTSPGGAPPYFILIAAKILRLSHVAINLQEQSLWACSYYLQYTADVLSFASPTVHTAVSSSHVSCFHIRLYYYTMNSLLFSCPLMK